MHRLGRIGHWLIAKVSEGYGRFDRWWHRQRPAHLLTLGFLSYVVIGVLLLALPIAQAQPVGWIDNLFNVTSAISTTGLTTVSVADSYTWFGELVLLCLFQLGGIGYMTVSSFLILARGQSLSSARIGILKAGFSLPEGITLTTFVRQVVVFTLLIETLGTIILYAEFSAAGVREPLWSAAFHCVSAFATAGFGLNNNSLEDFRGNVTVNVTIGLLCYLGATGFIILQDAWYALTSRTHQITFTSKVILSLTALLFFIATPVLCLTDEHLWQLPLGERMLAAAFQVMTASSTAGFNTVPIAKMSSASLCVIMLLMIIGASPSGTGGGIKTTTVSSLMAILLSILRGRSRVLFIGREIPLARLLTAVASTTLYLTLLAAGVFLLCLTEKHEFLEVVFETASALGTVGLSLGITSDLTTAGKLIITALMFTGRVGPVTIGLALLHRGDEDQTSPPADLAV